ncbi:MAG: caspase family protein [Verrucomicrobiota bacterium]|jgi:hypothetical protein|nr:caspase family protein [Verrucomicrobiota bacterium]
MKKKMFVGLLGLFTVCLCTGWGANYGVYVGLNTYSSSYIQNNDLSGCVPDANSIYTNTLQRGEWTAGTVTKLLNSSGTKSAIRSAISSYASTAVAGDVFFYFHSSHGYQISGTSVGLCSYNADYDDTELAADLSQFRTGVRVVVMVDACNSGGLFKSVKEGSRVSRSENTKWMLAERVSQLMDEQRRAKILAGAKDVGARVSSSEIGWVTAADYNQYSWDGDTGGEFTEAVIDGWQRGLCDNATYGNQDGYADFYELWNYAKDIAVGFGEGEDKTDAQCFNTNVLLATVAGWVGEEEPAGIRFAPMEPQTMTVGQTLAYPVVATNSDGSSGAIVIQIDSSTAPATSYSFSGNQLSFTPTTDGAYSFTFVATNSSARTDGRATLSVAASVAAPTNLTASSIGESFFTANWDAVAGAQSYLLDVATEASFSPGGSGEEETIVEVANDGVASSEGWSYVDGAEQAGSGSSAYHKLVSGNNPGVVSPSFSTLNHLEATVAYQVATFGGASANELTVSYSIAGGDWMVVNTDLSASSSSYVTQSMALPAEALGQADVRIKWHCRVADGSAGIRLRRLAVTGRQSAGGNTLILNGEQVAATSYSVTGLDVNSTYYFRVRAVGNAAGPYSAVCQVGTIQEPNSPPTLANVSAQTTTVGVAITPVQLSWSEPDGDAVTLDCATDASGDLWNLTSDGLFTFTPAAAGVFTFTFTASDDAQGAGNSVAFVVTAELAVPELRVVSTGSDEVVVAWSALAGAVSYELDVVVGGSSPSPGATLLTEDFSAFGVEGGSDGTADINALLNDYTETPGWTGSRVYTGGGRAKLGASGGPGWIATPPLDISGGSAVMEFAAEQYGSDSTILAVTMDTDGSGSYAVAVTNITLGANEIYTLVLSGCTATTSIKLDGQANRKRFYLDDVTISSTSRARAPALEGERLAGYPKDVGDVITYTVEGLAPLTEYTLALRVVGGSSLFSEWSEPVDVTTTDGPAAPAFASLPAQSITLDGSVDMDIASAVSGSPTPVLSLTNSTANADDYLFEEGQLLFIPSEIGTFTFDFSAVNSSGSASATLTVVVSAAPVYIPTVTTSGVASNAFTAEWTAVTGAEAYRIQVALDDRFSSAGNGDERTLFNNVATNPAVAPAGWIYAIGTTAKYLLLTNDAQYVQSEVFSTESYTSLALNFRARTYGGATGDIPVIQISISTDGGLTWEGAATRTPVNSSLAAVAEVDLSAYVGEAEVCVKWTCPYAGSGRGAGFASLVLTGIETDAESSLVLDATTPALSHRVPELDAATTYYVRVCDNASGLWSQVVSVTTLGAGAPEQVEIGDITIDVTAGEFSFALAVEDTAEIRIFGANGLVENEWNWVELPSSEWSFSGGTLSIDFGSSPMQIYRIGGVE